MIFFVVSILLLLICFIFNSIIPNSEFVSILFTIFYSFIIVLYILKFKCDRRIKTILLIAFFLRMIFLIIDVYFYRIPHAGQDDDSFYRHAMELYGNSNFQISNIYGGVYTIFVYFLSQIIGTYRLGIQFSSVMFSFASIILLYRILEMQKIDKKFLLSLLLIFSILPNGIFLNSILRRESALEFFSLLSFYEFSKWIRAKHVKNIILTFIFLLISTLIHSAMLFAIIPYVIGFSIYNHKKEKMDFKGINSLIILFDLLIIVVVCLFFVKNFDTKFSNINSLEYIYGRVNNTWGNSAYLTNYKITSLKSFIFFTPLKFVYFLFSPMPWDLRGVVDLSSFLLDSLIYLYLFIVTIKSKKNVNGKISWYIFLLVTLVFSIGTFTSGAAIRHRYSIFPFLIIAYSGIINNKSFVFKKK